MGNSSKFFEARVQSVRRHLLRGERIDCLLHFDYQTRLEIIECLAAGSRCSNCLHRFRALRTINLVYGWSKRRKLFWRSGATILPIWYRHSLPTQERWQEGSLITRLHKDENSFFETVCPVYTHYNSRSSNSRWKIRKCNMLKKCFGYVNKQMILWWKIRRQKNMR